MKAMKAIFLLSALLTLATTATYGFDEEPLNNRCTDGWGEEIKLPQTTANSNGMLDRANESLGDADKNDYYYIHAPADGTLFVTISKNVRAYVYEVNGDGNCKSDDIGAYTTKENEHNKTTSYPDIKLGKKYFIRVTGGKSGDENHYALDIAFPDAYIKNKDTPFKLVNPPETRNIAGDYKILGNTLMCRHATDVWNEVTGPNNCYQNGNAQPGNNNHIMNHVDIDNDPKTWNSSSSTFEIPANGEIAWVGLFWQGHIATFGSKTNVNRELRLAKATNSGFEYEKFGYDYMPEEDYVFKLENFDAHKLLVKIDNANGYTPVTADEIHETGYHTSAMPRGGPYAGFKDITALVKQSGAKTGIHTITVANLTSHMGKEPDLGIYGGWSAVVIYKNPEMHIKNISIFSGFTQIRPKNPDKTITVEGFKLPKNSNVDAWLSIFTGEGEASISGDSVTIDGEYMPGISEAQKINLFDGIPRFDGERYPNHKYNGNIDVDKYNVSEIMTKKRNLDPNIDHLSLHLVTGTKSGYTDAYFPSMVAFSTDLYVPDICYDYDVRMGLDIPVSSDNREINASMLPNMPLDVTIAIRSREGDFPLRHSKMSLDFSHSADLKFKEAKQSPDDNNFFLDAPIINRTHPVKVGFGTDADMGGGTVSQLETLYVKYKYEAKKPEINTKFDIFYDSTINFGNGDVNISLNTIKGTLMQCGDKDGYYPEEGIFNVERRHSDNFSTNEPNKRFPLFTKVAGKEFYLDLVHYNSDYTREESLPKEMRVLVELIDVDRFHVDDKSGKSAFVCAYPQEINGTTKIVEILKNKSRRKFKFKTDFALPNVAVRIKYLVGANGPVPIGCRDNSKDCDKRTYEAYFESSVDKETKYCTDSCGSGGTNVECSVCLEEHWARSVCSRDNFAIRPESYKVEVLDTNQSKDIEPTVLFKNNEDISKNLLAEYEYIIDAKTTLWKSNTIAKKYYQRFMKSQNGEFDYSKKLENTKITMFNQNPDGCNDKNGKTFGVKMANGRTVGVKSTITDTPIGFGMKNDNAGKYIFNISDKDFTKVDQSSYAYKTFSGADCLENQTDIPDDDDDKVGCVVSSDYDDHHDVKIKFMPDHFSLSDLILGRSPSSGKDWVYMSNMTLPNPMALGAKGYIEAKGYSGTTLSNFTNGCVAEDLNITVDMHSDTLLTDIKGAKYNTPIAFEYLVDNSIVPNDMGIVLDSNVLDSALQTTHELELKKENFSTAMAGSAELNLYYNFRRTYNDPVNPVKVKVEKISASSKGEKVNGHLLTDYTPTGANDYNEEYLFLYGMTNTERSLYETKSSSVLTPLSIRLYCDISYSACKNKGINSPNALLTLPWWRAVGHDTISGDGKIALKTGSPTEGTGTAEINKIVADIDANFGEDKGVRVSMLNGETPALFPIDFITDPHAINTTSDWLIYNEVDNSIPTPFYEVKFIGGSMWTGVGKTGNVINTQGSGKKSGRLQW